MPGQHSGITTRWRYGVNRQTRDYHPRRHTLMSLGSLYGERRVIRRVTGMLTASSKAPDAEVALWDHYMLALRRQQTDERLPSQIPSSREPGLILRREEGDYTGYQDANSLIYSFWRRGQHTGITTRWRYGISGRTRDYHPRPWIPISLGALYPLQASIQPIRIIPVAGCDSHSRH